jgi:hypothetical protein
VLIPQTMAHFTDIPMALVGMKWMAPLFGHTLPSATLYALWDRLLCKDFGGADILLCAALTVLRGIDSDVLRQAPHDALQLSAASIHDTAPFINAVGSFHRTMRQYAGSLPRAPHATSHHFSDEIESDPRCVAAWTGMQMEAMKASWLYTEHQMMRLADPFLSAAISSTAGVGAEACLSLSECEAVVEKLLPGLGLIVSASAASGAGGGVQTQTTLLGLLCLALSKTEPHVYKPGLTQPSPVVTLGQFAHGMHALHAGEAAAMPQRATLWYVSYRSHLLRAHAAACTNVMLLRFGPTLSARCLCVQLQDAGCQRERRCAADGLAHRFHHARAAALISAGGRIRLRRRLDDGCRVRRANLQAPLPRGHNGRKVCGDDRFAERPCGYLAG